MLLASINLNKRLGADGARSRFASWLRARRVGVVLAQEPFKPVDRTPPELPGFVLVGGDGRMAAWVDENVVPPHVSSLEPWAQRIELEWLVVLHVHLDSRSGASRAHQLAALTRMATAEDGRPLLVCGDFNLAPRPEDGRYGDEPSTFTTNLERGALTDLTRAVGLVDVMSTSPPVFTVERVIAGKLSRFRCDLVLLSDHLKPATTVSTDATVRSGPGSFTDHAAVLADLPVTPSAAEPGDVLFPLSDVTGQGPADLSGVRHRPHRTAMSRVRPSPASRAVTEQLTGPLGVRSVLDHGCGRGADIAHYRSHGLTADGFDPHEAFGWPRPAHRGYDLVTSMFVLNVLSDPWERIRALRDAASYARPGGHVVVVTRSPEEIAKSAAERGWRPHHDGYWSSVSRRTFQRGIGVDEITALARRAGLVPADGVSPITLPGVCHAVLAKPES